MKTVILIRGHSGSGKSQLAKDFVSSTGARHFENDHYLMKDGRYQWSEEAHRRAKARCFADYKAALAKGISPIVVSNVFAHDKSVLQYKREAEQHGYDVEIFRTRNWFIDAHNVSWETKFNMWKILESNPIAGEKLLECFTYIPKQIQEMQEAWETFYLDKKGVDFSPMQNTHVTPLYLKVKGWEGGYKVEHPANYPALRVLKYKRSTFYENSWDEALLEMRGMIVNSENRIIVRPFDKVFNYSERIAPNAIKPLLPLADDALVVAVEKVNGFLGVATYVPELEEVIYSTTGSMQSQFALLVRQHLQKHDTVFKRYPGYSFIFEICDKNDPHIIQETEGAYLIGCRHIDSGKLKLESELDTLAEAFNFNRPNYEIMRFKTLKEKLKTSKIEGYMVYKGAESFKMKSPFYLVTKFFARGVKDIEKKLSRQNVDEEFYPLIDHIKANLASFKALDEQGRVKFVRQFLEESLL